MNSQEGALGLPSSRQPYNESMKNVPSDTSESIARQTDIIQTILNLISHYLKFRLLRARVSRRDRSSARNGRGTKSSRIDERSAAFHRSHSSLRS